MNCEELRKYMEADARLSHPEFWFDSRTAAHVAACTACGQLVRERQSLRKSLELIRESIGSVPESPDAAVLAGYRHFIAERDQTTRVSVGKSHFPLLVRWGVVGGLALTVAITALFVHRKPAKTIVTPSPALPSPTIPAVVAQRPTVGPQIRAAKRVVPGMQWRSISRQGHSVVRAVAPIPDDFRGLMYCDELSCGGAMDMIRVQLPSSMIPRPNSAFRRAGVPVNADVLIGPDGVARGIRIEGREF